MMALVVISVTWVNFNQEFWKTRNVIQHDIVQYNSYLPALFYEKDLSLSFLSDTLHSSLESRLYSPKMLPGGQRVIKMSMGMAVSYLPFFALAHVYSKLFNYPADGFSAPYHFAIQFSSLFYYCLGLIFLWRILRLYFTDTVTALTVFCITFGTNVFYYLTLGSGMSHVLNFSLIAAFLFYTIEWHKTQRFKTALALGALGGFLILVRPINVLAFLFFVLFDIASLQDLKIKLNVFLNHKLQLISMGVLAVLIFLPQMLYWHFVTGHFLFNSYLDEHFYFNNPHVLKALFGFRKGWLVYTPIMLFAIAGFFLLKNRLWEFKFAIPVFFLVYIYVTFSWWCWWYGGSFGQRPLIDIYPVLAVPFALTLSIIKQQGRILHKVLFSLVAGLILLNLFQTVQAKYNIIHYDSMTRENYFRVFFTITKKEDREKYLQHPDYEKAKRGEEEN